MNYETAEQSIITRLAPLTVGGAVDIKALPDVQQDYKTPVKPTIWVAYQKSSFEQVNQSPTHYSIS